MLTVISPAKRLDSNPVLLPIDCQATEPAFTADAARLIRAARKLSIEDIRGLMGISEALAILNLDRFKRFSMSPAPNQLRPAALFFAGDTYVGLDAKTLDADTLLWAQSRLRILSGLYGLLRPLDAIQPYRLEMGSRLATTKGACLYDYWGKRLSKALNVAAAEADTDALINCASQEYFGAVDLKALKLRVITPVFLEEKGNEAKIVSFFAKKARGAMARYIAEHRLTDPQAIRTFDTGGYRFRADLSKGDRWVFLRSGA